jgi:hypothetical protein
MVFFNHLGGCSQLQVGPFEDFFRQMPQEAVDACFGPVVFAEGFVVGEDVNEVAFSVRQPVSVFISG